MNFISYKKVQSDQCIFPSSHAPRGASVYDGNRTRVCAKRIPLVYDPQQGGPLRARVARGGVGEIMHGDCMFFLFRETRVSFETIFTTKLLINNTVCFIYAFCPVTRSAAGFTVAMENEIYKVVWLVELVNLQIMLI